MYKYSNVGYERYKQNPHFYLPDGSLKRKFSLPKLSDSLEAVRQCRYLRKRHSMGGGECGDYDDDETSSSNFHEFDYDIKNIFENDSAFLDKVE